MATPLASKFFENGGTDGWDDWDWVENNNSSNASKQQQQQQRQQQKVYHQSTPPLTTVSHLPINVQQVNMDSSQTANLFNTNRKNSIPSQVGHPSIDQYVQPPPRLNNNNNNQLPMNAINNNVNNHFQMENQHQHHPHQQSYAGIESASFVNNNNSNNQNVDTMNSNNIVQSSAMTYYHSDHSQTPQQNQNQWPVSYGGVEGSFAQPNVQTQQFMQIESQEQQQFPPPIPARTQYTSYEQQTTAVEQNIMHDNGHYGNSQLENQQPAVPAEAPISTFSTANNSFPPVLPPPAINQTLFANTNPFKRVGSHAHRATSIMPTKPSPSITAPMMEMQSQAIVPQENVDSIPHNDRNEYLQTEHLSGDGESSNANPNSGSIAEVLQYNSNDGNGLETELPPPGLSRLVLGELEPLASNQVNYSLPPPAFDRLVPGTEINHTSNINLERQADGQDDIELASNRLNNNQFSSVPSQQVNMPLPPLTSHEIGNYEAISESDRNQYLVAGENPIDSAVPLLATASAPIILSTASSIEQRVVTGLENVENREISTLPESQRELEMDGENLEDQQRQQQQNHQTQAQHREGNAPTGTTITVSQSESIEELDAPNNKNPSNPSTGNDDSDREKPYFNRIKGSSSRSRNDDRPRKRDDKYENRYETEDTDHSTREKKHGKDRLEEKNRKYRGRSADLDENESHSYREGRGERSYREKYRRDDGERYDRRRHGESRSHRDDKYSRYETDGSRYDNEESRYERRRIGEKDDYGRYREGRADRGDRYYRSKDYAGERGKFFAQINPKPILIAKKY